VVSGSTVSRRSAAITKTVHVTASQLLAHLDDQVDHVGRQRGRRRAWTSGMGLESGLAVAPVAGQQLVQPRAGDAVLDGDFGNGSLLDHHSGDQQTGICHAGNLDAGDPSARDLLRHQSGVS
jgi:hypothetical protein